MQNLILFIISFMALLWASNHLITGAISLSLRFHVSPLLMGLTIVAFGGLPEIALSIIASLRQYNASAISNAIGVNIANISLVLGAVMLIRPMMSYQARLQKFYPIFVVGMLFIYSLIIDGVVNKIDGCIFLIVCIVVFSVFVYYSYHEKVTLHFFHQFKMELNKNRPLRNALTNILFGLVVLPISTRYMVFSMQNMASLWGLGTVTVGLTIHAIGATIPELATSIMAAFKNEEELAIGTILGSNIYNLLLVVIFPSLMHTAKFSSRELYQEIPVILGIVLLLFFVNFYHKKKLSAWHGWILILVYCSYMASMIIKAHCA